MLSHEEVQGLIQKAKDGDKQAIETMMSANMPLVKSIVKRYRSQDIEYDDLLQLGSYGLYKAIINFDLTYNVKFSTYAVPMIAGEIKRYIRDEGPIKISRQTKTLASSINRFIESYRQEHTKEPSLNEIAERFGVDVYDVVFALDSMQTPVSLYEQYDEDGSYLIDSIVTKDETDDLLDNIMLKECINSLPARDKKIIILRYYRDMTQTEVAKLLGVSQVQVSRLENRILKEIKDKMS